MLLQGKPGDGFRVGQGDKAQGGAFPRLRQQGEVGGDDRGDLGVAAGCLVVRHHDDGLAGGGDLHASREEAVGQDIRARG